MNIESSLELLLSSSRGREGFETLADAVEAGGAEAAAAMAVYVALGFDSSPDWSRALDLLQLAAERGWTPAQAALSLLAMSEPKEGPRAWRMLRERIDLQSWFTPPAKTIVLQSPRIRIVRGFIHPRICEWLIERARSNLTPARVFDYTGSTVAAHDKGRTNSETEFSLFQTDLVLLLLRERIAAVTGLPSSAMEPAKVLSYATGEQFHKHFDFLDPDEPVGADLIAREGQRLATFLVYLNDDYHGGETDFPLAPYRFRGQCGDALYFANVDDEGAPDRKTLHAGLPPTQGRKWVLSQWIRDRALVRD